jgi:hypothetical protein
MKRTYKIVYLLPCENQRVRNITGIALVEAANRNEASYKFKQMGISFLTIEKIEEL